MKGKGHITLTGNLGAIMQESARTALGFLRGNAESLGLQDISWEETDLHVHVPEGAIPKDGPSAGITLALAIYSCLADKKVRNDLAMTGEITLRGEVLPIGGLREKILAARRNGITEVLLPDANEPDLRDLPQWVSKGMTLKRVSHVMQVFENAFQEDS
jgi:ATP-dependent Lon protease